jgi:hypothetical protein
MATYDEMLALATGSAGSALAARVQVAVVISAIKISTELSTVDNHANRVKWARETFKNSAGAARDVLWYVIGANAAATSAAIAAASDALIQTNVDAAVNALAQG